MQQIHHDGVGIDITVTEQGFILTITSHKGEPTLANRVEHCFMFSNGFLATLMRTARKACAFHWGIAAHLQNILDGKEEH